MAYKVSTSLQKSLDGLKDKAEKAQTVVDAAVEKYNATVKRAHAELEDAINAYNETVNKVHSKLEDFHREKTEEFDNASEQFRDSESGEDVNRWLSEVEGVVEQAAELGISVPVLGEVEISFDTTVEQVLNELRTEPAE